LSGDQAAITAALGPAQAGATIPKSKSFRVLTTLSYDNGRRTSSEVVLALGEDKDKDKDPYHVLSWQDDVEAGHGPRKPASGRQS
jgi:general secretion pathway protein K